MRKGRRKREGKKGSDVDVAFNVARGRRLPGCRLSILSLNSAAHRKTSSVVLSRVASPVEKGERAAGASVFERARVLLLSAVPFAVHPSNQVTWPIL